MQILPHRGYFIELETEKIENIQLNPQKKQENQKSITPYW